MTFKLICRNKNLEEVFTVEGYETEHEAQQMVDALNRTQGPDNTWHVEPVHYN